MKHHGRVFFVQAGAVC